jgi:hypothetical protein
LAQDFLHRDRVAERFEVDTCHVAQKCLFGCGTLCGTSQARIRARGFASNERRAPHTTWDTSRFQRSSHEAALSYSSGVR